jgi:hypothetical protein
MVNPAYRIELLLELFIGIVDTKLLETVYLKGLKPEEEKEEEKGKTPAMWKESPGFQQGYLPPPFRSALPLRPALAPMFCSCHQRTLWQMSTLQSPLSKLGKEEQMPCSQLEKVLTVSKFREPRHNKNKWEDHLGLSHSCQPLGLLA